MDYNTVFYSSKVSRSRHVEYLGALARLYGMKNAAAPFAANVLEVGCATGDALIPLAIEFHQANFVGIDPATKQIEAAQKNAAQVGLENISFIVGDTSLLKTQSKKFDYIICHGVFSWIKAEERAPLLLDLKKSLAEHGVIYLSYNCSPGSSIRQVFWQSLKTMLSSDHLSSTQKFRAALEKICSSVEVDYQRPHQMYLYQELNRILAEPDSYLVHEVLAPENHSFTASEIENQLAMVGLASFTDARPSRHGINRILSASLSETGFQDFLSLQMEGARGEDLVDLNFGSPFREALIVHQERTENVLSNIDFEQLRLCSFCASGVKIEGDNEEVLTLQSSIGRSEKVNHPILKGTLEYLLASYPHYRSFPEILAALEKVGNIVVDEDLVTRALLEAFTREIVTVSYYPPKFAEQVFAYAKTTPWIRLQASRGSYVTNLNYQNLELDSLALVALSQLDGNTDRETLEATARSLVHRGEGGIKEDGVPVTDPEAIRKLVPIILESTLETLKKAAVLLP